MELYIIYYQWRSQWEGQVISILARVYNIAIHIVK